MKTLHENFEEKEFKKLEEAKRIFCKNNHVPKATWKIFLKLMSEIIIIKEKKRLDKIKNDN